MTISTTWTAACRPAWRTLGRGKKCEDENQKTLLKEKKTTADALIFQTFLETAEVARTKGLDESSVKEIADSVRK